MGDIKSAREIAMEKVGELAAATEDERLKWEYIPQGEKLAAKFLSEDCNLLVELNQYDESARRYVVEGVGEILARNVNLPKGDAVRKKSKRAMDGLKILKHDKAGVENIYSRMRRVFDHYLEQGDQQREQAYGALKTEFEARVQQAAQQQLGSFMGIRVDVEKLPQFQEEWRRQLIQLDAQYLRLLDEYKRELKDIV